MMTLNETYSVEQIQKEGFKEKEFTKLTTKVFEKADKVYFFDPIDNYKYRLFSIIHKQSFFL